MTNVFNLDAVRLDVDKEYASFPIDLGGGDIVTLRSILRVPKVSREKAYKLIDELQEAQKAAAAAKEAEGDDTGFDSTELIAAIALQLICIVADDADKANALVDAVQDDIPLVLQLFNTWMESTQAGEAQGSES